MVVIKKTEEVLDDEKAVMVGNEDKPQEEGKDKLEENETVDKNDEFLMNEEEGDGDDNFDDGDGEFDDGVGDFDEGDDDSDEKENEEDAIGDEKNEENVMGDEKNDEGGMGEEDEKGEGNAVEDEKNDNAVEYEKNENAVEDEKNENAVDDEKNEDAREDKEAENGKNKEKLDPSSNEKGRKPRKRIRRKKAAQTVTDMVVSKGEDKTEAKGKKQASEKVASMGMIFMCSSKTKKDCYHYKVLGLPANKKDIVEKIYKGMRLFLYDFDLRLMYGIYKAAGPGGSNLEPKAFKSAFPSQVRFTVIEDCLPLPEESFKKVIKDNYYSKNKFDCQLNSDQVKKLCKLFVSATKGSKSQKAGKSVVPEGHISGDQDRTWQQGRIEGWDKKLTMEPRRWSRVEERYKKLTREPRRQGRVEERDKKLTRNSRWRGRAEERDSDLVREPRKRRHHEHPVAYAREVLSSQMAPLPRAPAPFYAYESTLEVDPYRREPVIERHGLQLVEVEPKHQYVSGRVDPYLSYREREVSSDREPIYSARLQREYYTPAALPTEYRVVGREADYRAVGIDADYRGLSREVDYRGLGREADYRGLGREVDYRGLGREAEHRVVGRDPEYHAIGREAPAADLPIEYRSSGRLPAEYHSSTSLLAEYGAAGVSTDNLAPAGLPREYRLVHPATEYHSSSGALREYRPLQTMRRY